METISNLIEKAFDFRGDVTIVLQDGRRVEGYLSNRETSGTVGTPLPFIEMLTADKNEPQRFFYRDIREVLFTGSDEAAGKSWEEWQKKKEDKKKMVENTAA